VLPAPQGRFARRLLRAFIRPKLSGADDENTFQSLIRQSVEKPFHLGCRGALLGQNASYPSRIHS
jgi:hypothetical protein